MYSKDNYSPSAVQDVQGMLGVESAGVSEAAFFTEVVSKTL